MIAGLFTEILSPGGIQRMGAHAAVILSELAAERGLPIRLISFADPPGAHLLEVGSSTAVVEGCGRSRPLFLSRMLSAAPSARLAYIGHPRLASSAFLLPRAVCHAAVYGIESWARLGKAQRAGLGRCASILSISAYTSRRTAEAQGIPPARFVLVPPALDPAIQEAGLQTLPRSPPRGIRLLTVARLAASERYKGVDTVLEALSLLRASVPDISYTVVGDGDDRPRLEALAREFGVAELVRFEGRLPEEETLRRYAGASVFAMPSRGEGFGIVYLEAMAHGLPVVAADQGAAPEIVKDGVNGYLVPYGDATALADRLARLADPTLGARLGQAGRARVMRDYTFDQYRRRLREALIPSL